jgi:hypothetical protein
MDTENPGHRSGFSCLGITAPAGTTDVCDVRQNGHRVELVAVLLDDSAFLAGPKANPG